MSNQFERVENVHCHHNTTTMDKYYNRQVMHTIGGMIIKSLSIQCSNAVVST